MYAQKCPICDGSGKIKRWGDNPKPTNPDDELGKRCHACDGRGIIYVPSEKVVKPYNIPLKWE